MSKIALIIDGSPAAADYRSDTIFESWGINPSDAIRAQTFAERAKFSLINDKTVTKLTISSTDEVKRMVKIIETDGTDFVYDGFVMVIHSVNRNSTKKLEKLVAENDGQVIVAKAKDGASNVDSLLKEFYFNRETNNFIKDYVGNSIDMIIPILRTVSDLSPEQQKRISIEDILIRISPTEGEIEPWKVEDYILSGDVTGAIKTFRRINLTIHELVVLSILKKNFTLMHEIHAFQSMGKISAKELSEKLSGSEKQIKFIQSRKLRSLTLSDTTKMLQAIVDMESKMKGGESTDSKINMEILITKLCNFF